LTSTRKGKGQKKSRANEKRKWGKVRGGNGFTVRGRTKHLGLNRKPVMKSFPGKNGRFNKPERGRVSGKKKGDTSWEDRMGKGGGSSEVMKWTTNLGGRIPEKTAPAAKTKKKSGKPSGGGVLGRKGGKGGVFYLTSDQTFFINTRGAKPKGAGGETSGGEVFTVPAQS